MKQVKKLLPGMRVILALGTMVLAGVMLPGHAFAGYTVCDTDPTVTLSNGQTVSLWANISTDSTSVTAVNYMLHIPIGLRVVGVTYDQYAPIETFTWVADEFGSRYESDTTVTTVSTAGTVPVTAWASMPYGANTYSASGTSGQVLAITWKM